MTNAESPVKAKSLAQQLSEGRLPVQDGLRYAALLAEALRKMHDEGRAHGGVTPDVIAVDASGLQLLPPAIIAPRVTPYTAPEVACHNRPADARSDIFAFGAIVYEMFTARRAFGGDTETALAASICNTEATPSGSPAVDRLVNGCLSKDPAARWQRMQKIILELKLLTAAARRSATQPAARRDPNTDSMLRSEMQQIEARLAARLQAHHEAAAQAAAQAQKSALDAVNAVNSQLAARLAAHEEATARAATQVQQTSAEAVNSVNGQLVSRLAANEQATAQVQQSALAAVNALNSQLTARLAEHEQGVARTAAQIQQSAMEAVNTLNAQLTARLAAHEESAESAHQMAVEAADALRIQINSVTQQLASTQEQLSHKQTAPELERVSQHLTAIHERIGQLEQVASATGERHGAMEAGFESIKKQIAELHANVAADMHEFELTVKAQSNSIESARTAMAQTDDLVERVVEALEALQSTVLEHSEDRSMALN